MSSLRSWILLPLLVAPNVATPQTPGTLVEGQRIRVAYRCKVARDRLLEYRERRSPRVDTGQLRAIDADTLRLRPKSTDAELAIPVGYVDQVWGVNGRKSNFWAGARIGMLGGAIIGG